MPAVCCQKLTVGKFFLHFFLPVSMSPNDERPLCPDFFESCLCAVGLHSFLFYPVRLLPSLIQPEHIITQTNQLLLFLLVLFFLPDKPGFQFLITPLGILQ